VNDATQGKIDKLQGIYDAIEGIKDEVRQAHRDNLSKSGDHPEWKGDTREAFKKLIVSEMDPADTQFIADIDTAQEKILDKITELKNSQDWGWDPTGMLNDAYNNVGSMYEKWVN
jgi:hypothetical protein